jgi:hypothetical protein
MLTVSSLRPGIVTTAKKEGAGSAIIIPSGAFSGAVDLEYIVEIDSIAAGAEVGQATFRWSDGGGTWDGSGITTLTTNILLNNGVYVKWTTGAGADFVVGDKWYFKGINLFNAGKMIDLNRDHTYRSVILESPNTITIDLVTEQEVKALILFDHNLTAGTIVLEGDDAATFDSDGGSPQVSESITLVSGQILHYLVAADTTKRYWKLEITNTANPDGYIEIGELFLGSYMELSKNYTPGFQKNINLLFDSNKTPYGVRKNRFYNRQRQFIYDFNVIPLADLVLLEALVDGITDKDVGTLNPFFFNDDSAITGNIWMVNLDVIPEKHMASGWYQTSLEMTEVMKSV